MCVLHLSKKENKAFKGHFNQTSIHSDISSVWLWRWFSLSLFSLPLWIWLIWISCVLSAWHNYKIIFNSSMSAYTDTGDEPHAASTSIIRLPLTCVLVEGDFPFIGCPPPLLFPLDVESVGWREETAAFYHRKGRLSWCSLAACVGVCMYMLREEEQQL